MTGAAGGERSRLVRALALSQRFHLYLARCASPRAADELLGELPFELPRLGRTEVRLVRLEPYGDQRRDTPLTDSELAERVLLPLLDPPPELQGAIHVVDASRAAHEDIEAWARLFSLWNEKRNLLRPPRGEVVVILPAVLAPVFATAAPDVWSIRSGEYVVEEDATAYLPGFVVQRQGSVTATVPSLEVQARGMVTVRSVGSGVLTASVSTASLVPDVLLLLRAVPPLALFGGDLVVRPWVEDVLSARKAGALLVEERGLSGAALPLLGQRRRRLAEAALAKRQFDDAEALFSELLEHTGTDPGGNKDLAAVALSGLAIALAAQDRAAEAVVHGAQALSLLGYDQGIPVFAGRFFPGVTDLAVGANALVQWCLGHLEQAGNLDISALSAARALSSEGARSNVLRLVERGEVALARERFSGWQGVLLPRNSSHQRGGRREAITRMVAMDLEIIAGDLDAALFAVERASTEASEPWPEAHASLAHRCDVAVALVEIARGNPERAAGILARAGAETPSHSELEPEGGARAGAFHACTSGILEVFRGDREGAFQWFDRALAFISDWGRSGLDRRSRLRARLFVELLKASLAPESDLSVAGSRALTEDAEALLGDTAEDCVSRVLAVEAHRERARRLARAGAEDARAAAHRAAELARPLGGLGVPAWEALLQAAERQSAAANEV